MHQNIQNLHRRSLLQRVLSQRRQLCCTASRRQADLPRCWRGLQVQHVMLNLFSPCSDCELQESNVLFSLLRKGEAGLCTLMPLCDRVRSQVNSCIESARALRHWPCPFFAATFGPCWQHSSKHRPSIVPLLLTHRPLCACALFCFLCTLQHCQNLVAIGRRLLHLLALVAGLYGIAKRAAQLPTLVAARVRHSLAFSTKYVFQCSFGVKLPLRFLAPFRLMLFSRPHGCCVLHCFSCPQVTRSFACPAAPSFGVGGRSTLVRFPSSPPGPASGVRDSEHVVDSHA